MKIRRATSLLAAGLAMHAPASASLPEAPPSSGHLRTTRQHAFAVDRPLAAAFTFFEPIGEKRWAEDWQPVFATASDVPLHAGSVFTVERPGQVGSPLHSVWTITRYDPPHTIEYFNVLVGLRATRVAVGCAAEGPDRTCVIVRYTYTGLTPAGDAAIAAVTEPVFRGMIDGWAQSIAAYLARGTPASP